MEFVKFPKISRWASPFDITEKIDGTNAAVLIRTCAAYDSNAEWINAVGESAGSAYDANGELVLVGAQSRTRLITPEQDNYGFAQWVVANAQTLHDDLGPGTHYGEWWGAKIQRAYGLTNGERYFSLFDRKLYSDDLYYGGARTPGLTLVPLLTAGDEFSAEELDDSLQWLAENGSAVGTGFDRPEGVVVHFHHNGMRLKYIIDK